MNHFILRVLMVLQAPLELSQVTNALTHPPGSTATWIPTTLLFQLLQVMGQVHAQLHSEGACNFCQKLVFGGLEAFKDTHWFILPPQFQFVLFSSIFRSSFSLPIRCSELQLFQAHLQTRGISFLEFFNNFHNYVIPFLTQISYFMLLILVYFSGQTLTSTSVKSVKSGFRTLIVHKFRSQLLCFHIFAYKISMFPSPNIFFLQLTRNSRNSYWMRTFMSG